MQTPLFYYSSFANFLFEWKESIISLTIDVMHTKLSTSYRRIFYFEDEWSLAPHISNLTQSALANMQLMKQRTLKRKFLAYFHFIQPQTTY